ncbi:MAG: helix-turn-helix domain-containing protein [Ginsengibacter sp.]
MQVKQERHIGRNIRALRQLRGMKQETFARELGIAQQNVSKMENKEAITEEQLKNVAKVLDVTSDMIRNFDEKVIVNNNFLFNDQIINPVKEVIEYFTGELLNRDTKIQELTYELEGYRNKKRSAKTKSGITKPIQSVAHAK